MHTPELAGQGLHEKLCGLGGAVTKDKNVLVLHAPAIDALIRQNLKLRLRDEMQCLLLSHRMFSGFDLGNMPGLRKQ